MLVEFIGFSYFMWLIFGKKNSNKKYNNYKLKGQRKWTH